MSVDQLFTEAQLEAVRAATARAEAGTGGEVVSYVVGRCDDYQEARWQAATLGAAGAALAAAAWYHWSGVWPAAVSLWIALPPMVGAALGWLLASAVPAVQRALTDQATLARRVERRAAAAFLEEEIFATRERTGVLVFVAQLEHRVVILRDAGINARVDAARWNAIADRLAAGIRAGRAAEALVDAVGACGALLAEHGVERRDDDVNELSNQVRIRRE